VLRLCGNCVVWQRCAVQVGSDCIKGHCIMEPGLKRDIWIDLVDAGGQRLSSSNGKSASLLVNLSYEPLCKAVSSPARPTGEARMLFQMACSPCRTFLHMCHKAACAAHDVDLACSQRDAAVMRAVRTWSARLHEMLTLFDSLTLSLSLSGSLSPPPPLSTRFI
jgi:hypothetical protein